LESKKNAHATIGPSLQLRAYRRGDGRGKRGYVILPKKCSFILRRDLREKRKREVRILALGIRCTREVVRKRDKRTFNKSGGGNNLLRRGFGTSKDGGEEIASVY